MNKAVMITGQEVLSRRLILRANAPGLELRSMRVQAEPAGKAEVGGLGYMAVELPDHIEVEFLR